MTTSRRSPTIFAHAWDNADEGASFNDDFHVTLDDGEASGVSAFLRDSSSVFHTARDIEDTFRHMLEMLVIRTTSPPFRLHTAEAILLPRAASRGAGERHASTADVR
jgi:hypothetical protein